MKKLMFIILGILSFSACTQRPVAEKIKPEEVNFTPPSLVQSGFVRLEENQFIDTYSVKKEQGNEHLVSFDLVENLTQSVYAYPEQPQQYAKSLRKAFFVNCESHGLTLLNSTYYTEFWGKGIQSPATIQNRSLARVYKNSPFRILGQVVCTGIYQH
ncbi:surface-adhesin E family protein [Pasteurella oralis]|uniref:Surface-adhesin protein n=1 Tax=Pasteurella oralis TaxID=1071947 RepID=A0ABW4NX61_9PAST|nr:surface-adhesin E family protein [Pasteurella oralis]